jgi:hypothetical protein
MIIQGVTLSGVTVIDVEPALEPVQLLTNPDFAAGTTGWTASGGFGTYSYTSSNQIALHEGAMYFTYVSRTLSQTVNVSSVITAADTFTAVVNLRHREKGDSGDYTQIDTYTFSVVYKNSAGGTVITKTTGSANAPQNFTDIALTLDRTKIPATFDTIASAEVRVTGIDTGYWNGNHGPIVQYVTLTAT